MSALLDRLPEIWEMLVQLPISFWLLNAVLSLAAAFLACLLGSLNFFLINRKPLFDYAAILWISFQIIGLYIFTSEDIFLFAGAFILAIYSLMVHLNQTIRSD